MNLQAHQIGGTETDSLPGYRRPVTDLAVTLLLWTYFTLGFIILFSPFYLAAFLFLREREDVFQRLNHRFYRGFFLLVRLLIPRTEWRISRDVLSIRSSLILCNHVSYLDPILLISLYERQKTVVKDTFFRTPIFGRVLRLSGYIPSSSDGELSELMIRRTEELEGYMASGGNLFVFPEGTRVRNGVIGRLNKGAFKIARFCRRPITVLYIRNTDKVFQPGKFLFKTGLPNVVTVEKLASIKPDYDSDTFSISELVSQVRSLLEDQKAKPAP